ncbi:VanZ family protein [Streptomyces sp. TRM 70361]|uniref:VanZ family protein n=1 Tax=Streptomyces sp. TRM 70361 TaxID=3116553 RepID=UPI002E7C42BB|nr:VanZ family protein [Streptomyces sp. TRM 70361]MEE1938306.1 VanZ family protein [Streptomyces sp. TRM 70361]
MAQTYLLPIKTAAALFPLLALLTLLPMAVTVYRRHGVLSSGRALSLFGFLYYAFTALCMALVPLPVRTPDMCTRFAEVARPGWRPGHTLGDVWKEADQQVSLGALVLHNPAVAGAVFNVLLLLPIGVFVRCHVRRGLAVATAAGLGTSLFFELTQGTGIWGIYPCPYRLFDVDDLLFNTAGAALGWLVAGPVARVLPPLERLDERVRLRRAVPFGRRLTALTVDLAGLAAASALTGAVLLLLGEATAALLSPLVLFVLWFVVLPAATSTTPGKRLLRLRLTGPDGTGRPPLWRLLLRALLLGAVVSPLVVALAAVPTAVVLLFPQGVSTVRDADPSGLVHLADSLPYGALLLTAGFALPFWFWYGTRTLLHPRQSAAHEALSGVRNTALPPTSARSAEMAEGIPAVRAAADPAAPGPAGPGTGDGHRAAELLQV